MRHRLKATGLQTIPQAGFNSPIIPCRSDATGETMTYQTSGAHVLNPDGSPLCLVIIGAGTHAEACKRAVEVADAMNERCEAPENYVEQSKTHENSSS